MSGELKAWVTPRAYQVAGRMPVLHARDELRLSRAGGAVALCGLGLAGPYRGLPFDPSDPHTCRQCRELVVGRERLREMAAERRELRRPMDGGEVLGVVTAGVFGVFLGVHALLAVLP